jgi:hypothetical protein
MQEFNDKIEDIRERVIESERKVLMKKAASRFPNDKKRQEAYVYRTLNAKYGQLRQSDLVETRPEEQLEKPNREIPLSVWFSFKADSFGQGDCLADIMKRNVGECAGF